MKKTPAMRALDQKGIPYRATVYDECGAFHSAEEAARMLGVPLAAMYKTLVVLREGRSRGKPIVIMAPSDSDVDLKLLAASLGEKKLRMATAKEAEQLTGMRVGAYRPWPCAAPASKSSSTSAPGSGRQSTSAQVKGAWRSSSR